MFSLKLRPGSLLAWRGERGFTPRSVRLAPWLLWSCLCASGCPQGAGGIFDGPGLFPPVDAGGVQPAPSTPASDAGPAMGTTPGLLPDSGSAVGAQDSGAMAARPTLDAGPDAALDAGAREAGATEAGSDASPTQDAAGDSAVVVTPEPELASGCNGAKLYATSADDPGALGPWPVGVKTLKVPAGSASLTVEVWYPAKRGSEAGKSKQPYDLRDWLPTGAAKVPEAKNKLAICECYRDLPLDTDHGPYPAVVYIHGLGSMRIASVSTMATWASHGFIVVAADHPGDMLTDFLASFGVLSGCSSNNPDPGDMAFEAKAVIAAMNGRSAGFDFFGSSMDLTRMALGGHSQGGGTVAGMADTPNVKVVITLAPLGGGALNAPVESMLQVTGTIDSVTGYSTSAYTSDRSKIRRHVGILNAGHIDVTDLCKTKNPEGKTGIQVAADEGVCGALVLSALAQCGGDAVATDAAPLIVNYATTAALEETLHCVNRDKAFSQLRTKYPQVSEFLHTP